MWKDVTDGQKKNWPNTPEAKVDEPTDEMVEAWNSAFTDKHTGKVFGRWNPDTGYFEGNGILDISKAQARRILDRAWNSFSSSPVCAACIRTMPPFQYDVRGGTFSLTHLCYWYTAIEALSFGNAVTGVSNLSNAFQGARALKRILGMRLARRNANERVTTRNTFLECSALVDLELANLNEDLDLSDCVSLSEESVRYVVANRDTANFDAWNPEGVSVTLHPDVFSKLPEEVFAMAIDKNITLTTV